MIVAVAGIPRSGTTLLMHMLAAGGMPVYCDPDKYGRSFETSKMLGLPGDFLWMEDCNGKAVKLLEPLTRKPPRGYEYRFILPKRDPLEQAKSQIKLLVNGNPNVTFRNDSKTLHRLAISIKRDTHRTRKMLERMGPIHQVQFEELLEKPDYIAGHLSTYVGEPLDVDLMVSVVRPRGPECYNGLLELEMLRGDA